MTRILVVDNYDSFVYILNGYLHELGVDTDIIRNDDVTDEDAAAAAATYDGVLISPGPGTPSRAGVSVAMVKAAYAAQRPLLGVCLGHQAIAEAFGGVVTNAEELMHGKTSLVQHDGSRLYEDLPQPFTATRYHSLAILDGTLPDEITVTSRTESGTIMGIEHRTAPIFGVQFHPESVLTEGGYQLLGNWLGVVGDADAKRSSRGRQPLVS